MTYSLDELENRPPSGGGGIPDHLKGAEMQTIAPGTLKAHEIFGPAAQALGRPAAPPPAGSPGLQTMHTMLNDPAQPVAAMAQLTQAQGLAGPSVMAAAAAMAMGPMTQRHPAVQRLPHEEVSITVKPVEPVFDHPTLIVQHDPDSEAAAAYRVLGHRLTKPTGIRTLLIAGAEDGDGKTTCAANLALAMSEYGRANILLVEANLRAPALGKVLGFRPPQCFAAQLKAHKKDPMGTWTIAKLTPWLHAMVVDPETFEQPELIDALAIELAVEHFKRLPYDYILIDTPSVLGQADVPLMVDCADGVVITAVARRTSGAAIRQATQMLAPANIMGIALIEG